ncbi:FkbM family methyltransferase [Pseudoxanthomonas putridarboris]|uniref:FkbM family methyltransferase n=1 Tax=Pseudoxanthomonas putridarboris TaxID=752605 RepID=UPI00312031ED
MSYGEKNFQFLLPSLTDHISKIVASGTFYESKLLSILKAQLQEGDLVLDVGANIGNHTVFFAGVCGCRVEAFEVNPEACHFLKATVRLNGLEGRVQVNEVALSDVDGHVSIAHSVDDNLGAISFRMDDEGELPARRLDGFDFDSRVVLIKIDVEGMEAQVIRGAENLIRRDRPIIVYEAQDADAYAVASEMLSRFGYIAVGCFNATDTYIFVADSTNAEKNAVATLQASGLISAQHDLKDLSRRVSASKNSLDKIAMQQRNLTAAIYGSNATENNPVPILERLASLDQVALRLGSSVEESRNKVENQQASLLTSLTQLASVAYSAADVAARVSSLSEDIKRFELSASLAASSLEERIDGRQSEHERSINAHLQALSEQAKAQDAALLIQKAQLEEVRAKFSSLSIDIDEVADQLRSYQDKVAVEQENSHSDVRQLWATVNKFDNDSASRIKNLRAAISLEQKGLAERLERDHRQLEQQLERALEGTRSANERFDALMNGRIFSFLRLLKQIGRRVLHPFPQKRAMNESVVAEAGKARELTLDVPSASSEIMHPTAVTSLVSKTRPETNRVNEVNAAQAATAVSAGADVSFSAGEIVEKVLRGGVPYMSRRSVNKDLSFLERPLPVEGLISVVMTTFNTRNFVGAAIESILNQTHRNLELIVVDDGSTDGTIDVVQAAASRDSRVTCISFGVNRGTYWCKNYGITKAKGVAVTFMDSDDVSEPTRLEKQYVLLGESGCAVTTCLHERRDLAGSLLVVAGRTKRVAYISQMMRKGVFDLLGYFDSVRTSADDEMLRRIKRFIGIDSHRTVHEVLYKAVVREFSLTQDPSNGALSAQPGILSEPRKAYSDAVDRWHETLFERGRYPYVPFPVVRRPFPIHERLRVAGNDLNGEPISVCIATFPARERQLKVAVNSLIDQVDFLFVYLNEYTSVPEFLKHPRIVVKLGGANLRDNGKFYFMPSVPDGYCFTVDDDIVYPKDYVQSLIRRIEIYGRKAAVGVHGTIFSRPFVSYFEGRRVFHFRQGLGRDHVVDQLGTGTLAFHTSLWRPSCDNFSSTGMVDAWIAVEAKKLGVTLVAIERRKAWLTPIPDANGAPPSLFDEFRSSADQQTRLIASSRGWGAGVSQSLRDYLESRIAASGSAFAEQICELEMVSPAQSQETSQANLPGFHRERFRLAIVGRTNKERWKKGGILKSTHLTADMLRPLGIEVALIDLEMDDPRTLNGFDADIVMVYPGDPERPDFKDVIELVDHHARQARSIIVNLSLNGRDSRKHYICEQMSTWRALYGKRVGLMVFGDRVEDDPLLAPVADMLVAIPKTLSYEHIPEVGFSEREGIFLGDYGKLCDQSLLAWSAEEAIESLRIALPDAHLFCVQQYRPRQARDLGIEVLPFLQEEYTRVLSRSRLMISLVKYATFEMVPMEVAAMGVPVLHPKMDNSLSDYLGLGAVEVRSIKHMTRCAKAIYEDPDVWGGVSRAGSLVAKGLTWENMSAQMYLRLLTFHKYAQS